MIVYLITNLVTGKRYVGKTKRDLEKRWYEHTYFARIGDVKMTLYDAIRKHGPEAFEKSVLSEVHAETEAEAEELLDNEEKRWIAELKPEYNGTEGGDGIKGYKHTEDAKRRIGEAHRGAKNFNYGKDWGRKGPLTEEMKRKLSLAKKGVPVHNKESKAKISEALRKRVRKTKKIVQLRDGQQLAIFSSAKEAADAVFGNQNHIREVCLGTTNRRSHRGYEWAYLTEETA